jgi:adenine-specific DNA methylase
VNRKPPPDCEKHKHLRACAGNVDHARAKELFDRNKLPAFHDPFAGGGALPLEAQRLGLEACASDLNPVAVLICKAMIEDNPTLRIGYNQVVVPAHTLAVVGSMVDSIDDHRTADTVQRPK